MLIKRIEHITSILLLSVVMLSSCIFHAQEYGLNFQSDGDVMYDRTGFDLSPNNFISFKNEFDISFDLKIDLESPNPLFGYILRVVSESGENFDLLLSSHARNKTINLIVGDDISELPIDAFNFNADTWVNIRIKFSLKDKEVSFYLPKKTIVKKAIHFSKKDSFKILFGTNSYSNFATADVPDMKIRDVKILKSNDLIHHFPLNETQSNVAHDIINKRKGLVTDPNWLLTQHQFWNNDFSYEFDGVQLITADEENGLIFLVGNDQLISYNTLNGYVKKIKYENTVFNLNLDYRAIFNPTDNKIYCYKPEFNSLASLDIKTGNWSKIEVIAEKAGKIRYQKHSSLLNVSDNSIYIFGGYGQYKYNSEVQKIDLTNKTWKRLSLNDSIFSPRYLAGLGISNDKIYMLGGYGSLTGDQMVNPKSYFDFLEYNIKEDTFSKKFDIPNIIDDMVVAGRIWIDENNKNYYALVSDKVKYENSLQLIQGNLDNAEVKTVGDTIPNKFLDIKTYSSFFYMAKQKKLYSYTSLLYDESSASKTVFNIYSIAYPPVAVNKNYAEDFKLESTSQNFKILTYALFILFVMLIIVWYLYYLKSKKRKSGFQRKSPINSLDKINRGDDDFNPDATIKPVDYQIIFFGGFQVLDKNKNDITGKFSPLLKELFLLIWLNTFKNNKGISSDSLIDILWSDKTTRKAQNNRSVNIAKLKGILNEMGGCELNKETGYWKIIHVHAELKSDYYDLLKMANEKNDISNERINKIINITEKGPFLANLNYSWLDEFKAHLSDKIINTLLDYAETVELNQHPNFAIRLADCVFNFDPINEAAMMIKCKAQYAMGMHSLAESTFKKFVKEYKELYDQEEYGYSFMEILD